MISVQALKRRLEARAYEVNATAVAAAILRRPAARLLILPQAVRWSTDDAQSRGTAARRGDR
jgi:hypothetical protein